jgi:hypothetical protein
VTFEQDLAYKISYSYSACRWIQYGPVRNSGRRKRGLIGNISKLSCSNSSDTASAYDAWRIPSFRTSFLFGQRPYLVEWIELWDFFVTFRLLQRLPFHILDWCAVVANPWDCLLDQTPKRARSLLIGVSKPEVYQVLRYVYQLLRMSLKTYSRHRVMFSVPVFELGSTGRAKATSDLGFLLLRGAPEAPECIWFYRFWRF